MSFESGNFTGFETFGAASIEDASFGAQPTDGNAQALLSANGTEAQEDVSQLEAILSLEPGTLADLGGTEGSALTVEVEGVEGETISFDFSFLTDETTPSFFNDFAVVSLTSEDSSVFEVLADTSSDNFVGSLTDFRLETLSDQFTFTFDSTGTFTLGLAVLNEGDSTVNSALLIDNIVVTTSVPEPSAGLLLTGALLGLLSRRRKS